MTRVIDGKKVCTGCFRNLPLADYRKHKNHGSHGIDSQCKSCVRSRVAQKVALKRPVKFGPPKLPGQLVSTHRAMLKQTPEAFEAFFNEFSHEDQQMPPHVKPWVATALAHKLLLLNVPPGHAKTTYMAEWFPIWQFACNRNAQILVVTDTDVMGKKIARKIATELESNQRLNLVFGRFRPLDNSKAWRVGDGELEIEGKDTHLGSGDLSLQIRGSSQAILGMRADWVIADDVTNQTIAGSEAQRKREWDWFLGDVMSRLTPDGKAFCIGQRVHSQDLYGRLALLADDEDGTLAWDVEKQPAILDYEEKVVLWPEFWPWKKLRSKQLDVGTPKFNCMYQQQPEVSGDFVPKWWIVGTADAETPGCLDHSRVIGEGWKNKDPEEQYVPVTRILSVDPSPTKYAAIVVADVVYQQRAQHFYCSIVDIRRDKMGLRGMLANIEELARLHRPSICVWETNSAKQLMEDPAWNQIAALFLKIQPHNTTINKRDEELGVWSLASDFEAGRIRLPYGDKESRETSNLLIDEVLSYPNGYTNDVLMALWFIKFNYKRLIPREFLPSHFTGSLPGTGDSWARGLGAWRGFERVG